MGKLGYIWGDLHQHKMFYLHIEHYIELSIKGEFLYIVNTLINLTISNKNTSKYTKIESTSRNVELYSKKRVEPTLKGAVRPRIDENLVLT